MGVDRARTVGRCRRPRTATDGLVVPKRAITKQKVIHGPLARRGQTERPQQTIDNALACLDISTRDSRK